MKAVIDHWFATYGTLGPGRPNHHQLAELSGTWSKGTVRGRLVEEGWGAALGYPALILDEDGEEIGVDPFHSDALPLHWARLDAFEGPGYRRIAADVTTASANVAAWIYVAA